MFFYKIALWFKWENVFYHKIMCSTKLYNLQIRQCVLQNFTTCKADKMCSTNITKYNTDNVFYKTIQHLNQTNKMLSTNFTTYKSDNVFYKTFLWNINQAICSIKSHTIPKRNGYGVRLIPIFTRNLKLTTIIHFTDQFISFFLSVFGNSIL